jgi:hypothetical protein
MEGNVPQETPREDDRGEALPEAPAPDPEEKDPRRADEDPEAD